MTIVAVITFQFKPETMDEGIEMVRASLKETRAFAGCISVEVSQVIRDRTTVVLIERWESIEENKAYRAFRMGDGAMPDLMELLTALPVRVTAELRSDL